MIIIVGIVICCVGIGLFLASYFFYNKYYVHARMAVLDRLSERYQQEFDLLSTEFGTREFGTREFEMREVEAKEITRELQKQEKEITEQTVQAYIAGIDEFF